MDYKTYWERSPWLVEAYREAHEMKMEQQNQMLYMQGRYNYEAFSSVIGTFAWGMGGKKGTRPEPYRDRPIPITAREVEAERKRDIEKTLAWIRQGQQGGGT